MGAGAGRKERAAARQADSRPARDFSVRPRRARAFGSRRRRSETSPLAGVWGSLYGRALPGEHGTGRMSAVFWLIDTIIDIYIWLLIAQAILSWLLAFGVVNRWNRGVSVISDFLYRVTEPLLRPIRSFLPNFGGVDISPVILILLLMFLRKLILSDVAPAFF
jgi:YggT family protein